MNRYLIYSKLTDDDIILIEKPISLDEFLTTPLAIMPLFLLDYLIITPFTEY